MGHKTEFLYLNEEEMIQTGVLDSARCIDVEEETFALRSRGDYAMGGDKHNSHGIAMKFPKQASFRTCHSMDPIVVSWKCLPMSADASMSRVRNGRRK